MDWSGTEGTGEDWIGMERSGTEGKGEDWNGKVSYMEFAFRRANKMKKYEVEIKGVGPAIQNRLSRELNKELADIPNNKREEWEEENYHKKAHTKKLDEVDVNFWPSLNIHAMLVEGCKKYKVPAPKVIGRTWTAYVKSCVLVEDDVILTHSGMKPFGIMVNGNPSSSKGSSKVYRVRPMFEKWSAKLYLIDTADNINKKTMKEIVEHAGKFVGLSDFRPQYGRFIVLDIKEVSL